MAETTVIRNADWLVAWDAAAGGHVYRQGADLAFADDRIVHVGPGYDGPVAREIDGSKLMVLPGLIDIHSHPLSEPMSKGFAEDSGNPRLGLSGLFDYMPAYGPDEAGMLAAAEVAYAELLKSGVTTLVDLSGPYPGWLELFAQSGLRGYAAPMFRSARWVNKGGHRVEYDWAEDGGKGAMAAALELVDQALNHPCGRLSAMVTPAQADTCTPELLQAAQAAARERRIPLHTHAAQSLVEFNEITRRHGQTPIQWLHDLGLLASDTILAHAIFLDSHSWIFWGSKEDLMLLAKHGVTVAHCPTVFARHGMLLESFAGYRAAGVNVGIGTDTYPHNMLEELRLAALLSRAPQRHTQGAGAAEVFAAATIDGAKALGRDDIGRLAVGAKADIVLVDLDQPTMKPLRDPLRGLVHQAADRAVRDVYVDGRPVVKDGAVLTLDYADAAERLDAAHKRAETLVPEKDWAGRSSRELVPPSLPVVEG